MFKNNFSQPAGISATGVKPKVTANSIALRLPKQSAADMDEKSGRNSKAISSLFETKNTALCKGKREGLLFSGSLFVTQYSLNCVYSRSPIAAISPPAVCSRPLASAPPTSQKNSAFSATDAHTTVTFTGVAAGRERPAAHSSSAQSST